MNHEAIARQVIDLVGGPQNISNMTHCMTRLRLALKDPALVSDGQVRAIPDVMGAVSQGDEYQVIIGPDVDIVYKKAQELMGGAQSMAGILEAKPTAEKERVNPLSWLLELMSASLSPLIPVIMGAAFITIVLTVCTMAGVLSAESQTYQVLNAITSCVYHFFPVLIAYTASKQLQVNQAIAIAVACFLLFPDYIALFNGGETAVSVFGIPIKFASYSKQIFPTLFAVMAQVWIEKGVYRVVPKQLKTMVASGLTLAILVILSITVFGPLGALLTEGINAVVYFVVDHMGWMALPIIAFINPFMLGTGLGSAVFPIMVTSFVSNGYEALILPAALAGNAAQVGSGLAVALMTKNPELKSVALEGALVALFGVTEPIIFTMHYKLKRTFIAVMVGSGVAAVIPGIFDLKCYALANGIFSLPAYLPGGMQNLVIACISLAAGIACGFIVTRLVGFDEKDAELEFNGSSAA